jgi:predicted DNA-binding transcriptional regulator YafY
MQRPATRLLAVLELLQAHGRLPGSVLAAKVGVDIRTLRRYIAALEDLGIPVMAERGRHGGYALVAGFKLPPMMFTDDEALALSIGLLAARQLGLANAAPATASARAKLERVMPAKLQRRARAIDETVAVDLAQGIAAAGDNEALHTLSTAAQARQRVRLRYRNPQGEASERDFDPYGLVWRSGGWYVVGHCRLRGGVRSFRLDRILEVTALPASFGRPEGFDARGHLDHSIATLPRRHAIEVHFGADLASVRRALFAAVGVFEPSDGGTLLWAQADDLNWFARELSRLPFDFEIRRPAALRAALRAHAQRLLERAGEK